MTPYALARHVFVCLQDEHVVFLDVRNDRYFALEAEKTRGLELLVDGWPVRRSPDAEPLENVHSSGVLQVLTDRGLLTRWARAGKDARPVDCSPPLEQIYVDDPNDAPSIGAGTLRRFITAAVGASLSLKYVRLERTIRQAQLRRARAERSARAFDERRVRQLIAAFVWLRPYFFSSRDACLFEALALGRFLAS